jgi:hypothetical protein
MSWGFASIGSRQGERISFSHIPNRKIMAKRHRRGRLLRLEKMGRLSDPEKADLVYLLVAERRLFHHY